MISWRSNKSLETASSPREYLFLTCTHAVRAMRESVYGQLGDVVRTIREERLGELTLKDRDG